MWVVPRDKGIQTEAIELLVFPKGSSTMATKNLKNNIPSSATAEKTVKKAFNKLPKKANPSKLEWALGIALMLIMLAPLIMGVVSLIRDAVLASRKGLKGGKGYGWLTGIEVDGLKIEGQELIDCAHEGASARAKKAKEEAEAAFDRRVANAVKKAQQGQQKM